MEISLNQILGEIIVLISLTLVLSPKVSYHCPYSPPTVMFPHLTPPETKVPCQDIVLTSPRVRLDMPLSSTLLDMCVQPPSLSGSPLIPGVFPHEISDSLCQTYSSTPRIFFQLPGSSTHNLPHSNPRVPHNLQVPSRLPISHP